LDNPVGSGPFALVEHTEGRFVLRNTGGHYSTRPMMDSVVAEIIRDEGKALQALKDGQFDALAWDITPAMAADVQTHPQSYVGIQLATAAGVNVRSLLFNLRVAPYDNPALRLALAQAIDTQALVDGVQLGLADRESGDLFAPSSPWHDQSIVAIPSDPEQAKEKLTLAGFVDRDGDGLRENPDGSALQITITCAKTDAELRTVELVVAQWKVVGIGAKASTVAAEQILPLLMQAKFQVVLHDLSLRDQEDAFAYFHSSHGALTDSRVSGQNYGGYANADYDRIAELLREEHDRQKRLELLRELQGMLASDLPAIPLYSPQVLNLYRDDRFVGWQAEPGVGLSSRRTIANLSAR
jgi:peptide/nickel transport system substrate-binding protein